MSEGRVIVLSPSTAGRRLDQYVAEQVDGLSRSRARDLILEGSVRVGGALSRPSYRVQPSDDVRVRLATPVPSELVPESMPLTLLYEDDDMLVLDKPAGLAVHPAPGHAEHTLVHALLARYPNLPGIGGVQRPGIVHRLDMDTSGLLMVAKSERGLRSLAAQLESRTVRKGYLALLSGALQQKRGLIDAPIARDPAHRQRMAIVSNGREARTRFAELAVVARHSFVLAMPETGRTHQIRVHFSGIGAPVVGDRIYGGNLDLLDRQFLHAALLEFARPGSEGRISLRSPLPADLRRALELLLLSDGVATELVTAAIDRMLRLAEERFRREFISTDGEGS